MNETIRLLKEVPIFTDVAEAQLEPLVTQARRLTYPKNTIVMTKGDAGDAMYLIESGKVKVFVSDEDGREMIIYVGGTGSYIGEISLLDDAPRSASVMTMEKTVLISISKARFRAFLRDNPEAAFSIIRSLTSKLRFATDWIHNLALKNVYRRLIERLYELADEPIDEQGRTAINKRYSQKQLGDFVGASREMIGKIIKDLTEGEYLTFERDRIVVNRRPPAEW